MSDDKPQTRSYKSRAGERLLMPSVELLEELEEDGLGFCLNCGSTQPIESDAFKCVCENCDKKKLYGSTELVIRGICF